MMRTVLPAGLALAACAAPPDPGYTSVFLDGVEITSADTGVIVVSGAQPDLFSQAHLKCGAARAARDAGFDAMDEIGGLVTETRGRFEGRMTFHAYSGDAPALPPALRDEVAGGPRPVDAWLGSCDEAGVPREEKAA